MTASSRLGALIRSATPYDAAAAVAAVLVPIAYVEGVFVPSWTTRAALLLIVLGPGLWLWIRALSRRDPPAIAALALVVCCTLGTLVAEAPRWTLRGAIGRDSSALFLTSLMACWLVGREVSPHLRRPVAAASLVALGANAALAIAQLAVAPETGPYRLIGDRPGGFFVNPVYLGAAAAGATLMCVAAVSSQRGVARPWTHVAIAVFGGTAYVTGSRGAIIALALGVALAWAAWPHRRAPWALGSLAAGFVVGHVLVVVADGRLLSSRITSGGSGADGRFAVWRAAVSAFADRPVFGWGFQQFRAAVQGSFDADFYRAYGSGAGAEWPDAHNLVLQYAVVGGLAGVVALLAFVWFAGRAAHGPLALAAGGIAVTWLLQPITLATGSLGLLWLGLASVGQAATADEPTAPAAPRHAVGWSLLVVGLCATTAMIVVTVRLDRTVDDGDAAAMRTWADRLPDDPVVIATAASMSARLGDTDAAVELTERVVALEPHDAVWWSTLALRRFDAGLPAEAEAAVATALEVDPWHPFAHRVALALAERRDDRDEVERLRERLCRLGEPECD